MDELFDPTLYNNDESQLMEIKRCVEVALLCTQCDRADRPAMEDVLQMLRGLKEVPTPQKPSYMERPLYNDSSPSMLSSPSILSDVSLSPR